MNRMSSSLVALLACLWLPAALAMGPGFEPPDPLHRVGVMADRLGLTEAQEGQLMALMNAARVESAVDRERAHQIRQQLEAMRTGFDAEDAEELARELGEVVARLAFTHASTRARVHALLTPEQQQRFEELRHRREDRWAHFDRARHRDYSPSD